MSKVATAVLIVSWLAWVAICETMRSQVNAKLAPREQFQKFQSSLGSGWWGRGGLWQKHAQIYPHSRLRAAFWVDVVLIVASVVASILAHR